MDGNAAPMPSPTLSRAKPFNAHPFGVRSATRCSSSGAWDAGTKLPPTSDSSNPATTPSPAAISSLGQTAVSSAPTDAYAATVARHSTPTVSGSPHRSPVTAATVNKVAVIVAIPSSSDTSTFAPNTFRGVAPSTISRS